jgi:protein-disulfide isomerase
MASPKQSRSRHDAPAHSSTQLHPPVGPLDHAQGGDENGSVTLVEYGDYQCPYCGMAYPIVKALQARLGDGLRFVFRNFPLTELHPHALHAAEAAESVAAHAGPVAFWAMHDLLFERQSEWVHDSDERHFPEYAARAGAQPAMISRDIEDGAQEQRVREDFMSGVRSGVNGTPTFFINGERFDGDWTDADQFLAALQEQRQPG